MNILKRLFCRHDYKFVRNIEWKRSLWMCPKCGRFQYRNEIKCDGCNNFKGCINCEDGSEWAHYEEEHIIEDLEEAANAYIHNDSNWIHPRTETFKAGARWQKEQMIAKACKWLSNVSIEDMTYKYNDFDTSEDWYKFIEDFKQAMEQ